jgi:PmbA protein
MEKLLEIARRRCDKAEVYSLDQTVNAIIFENAKLKNLETKLQSGISLRIIKDNKLGFAYTKNLINREELLKNALDSLQGGVEATFDFPKQKDQIKLNAYDPAIESLSNHTIVEECNRISKILTQKTKGQINITATSLINKLRIINDKGTDLSYSSSHYVLYTAILYPGSYAAIRRLLDCKTFEKAPDKYLDFLVNNYNQASKGISPPGGKMKVLFMPETMYVLMWRIQLGANGASIYQKQSPLVNKIDKPLFDKKLNIYDDPLNDKIPGARSFDDEGTPCSKLPIVEDGVLKNFYFNLYYAQKMNKQSTGHGYKTSGMRSETIVSKPNPSLMHLFIKPGDKSYSDLLKLIDKGIIVAGALGAHSGNIPNGDFSIGLSPGLYVENREIVGYVKDAMVAGNVYNTMKNIVAIEDTVHPAQSGMFPATLFDNVSVATKK